MPSYEPMTLLIARDDTGAMTQYVTGPLEGQEFGVLLGVTKQNKAVLFNLDQMPVARIAAILQAAVDGLLDDSIEKNHHQGDSE